MDAKFDTIDISKNIQIFEDELRKLLNEFQSTTNCEIVHIGLHLPVASGNPRRIVVDITKSTNL